MSSSADQAKLCPFLFRSQLYTMSRKDGLGEEVKRRIMVGTFALSTGYYDAFYLRAQKIRTLVAQDFQVRSLFLPLSPRKKLYS